MTRLAPAAAVVAILASLLYNTAAPAYACSCASWPETVTKAQTLIAQSELAVIAHPSGYTSDDASAKLVMEVTRVLNGPDVTLLTMPTTRETVEWAQEFDSGPELDGGGDCSYHVVGNHDDLYFLNLIREGTAEGEWGTNTCLWSSSFVRLAQADDAGTIWSPIGRSLIEQFGPDALDLDGPLSQAASGDVVPLDGNSGSAPGDSENAAPQTESEAESDDKDLPIAIILPLAFLIPIAVLVVFSLIKPKGGGH